VSFVLDNSVTMRWLFGDGKAFELTYASNVLDAMKTSSARVPVTWGLEVANVIARAEAQTSLTAERSDTFLALLDSLDINVDNATFARAMTDTLSLARRYKLSSYDASYLELALRLDVPLATLDEALAKAAKKAGVKSFS
jgi:predicted nucleic acid-binding protein